MLVSKKIHNEEDGSIGYIESIYESSNILTSTYFPKANIMYIAFNKGSVYSYGNISEDIYKKFEESESQGKFFVSEIKKNSNKYPFLREFKLIQSEIDDANKIIKEWKETKQQ